MTARTGSQGGVTGGQSIAAARMCAHSVAWRCGRALRAVRGRLQRDDVVQRSPDGLAAHPAPTIAFDSIDGPPVGVFNRLVDNLSAEAQGRQLAIASREGAANYRVRGYLAAQVIRGRTHISWVWDVYDDDKLRALRIVGEEAGGRAGADPWSVADEAMLRRIARASMERLAGFVAQSGRAGCDPATAVADTPEPARRPQRRRSAEGPSAAERLALSAAR